MPAARDTGLMDFFMGVFLSLSLGGTAASGLV
jgi:hypothetical protein